MSPASKRPVVADSRQGTGRLFRMVVLSLIVLAVYILVLLLHHRPDEQVARSQAERFIVTMQSDDPGAAYDMGNESFRSAVTEEQLRSLFSQVHPYLVQARIDKVDSYYAVSSSGNPREILVYKASKAATTTYIRIVMDKQADGAWKVHSLITKAQPLQAKPE